MGSRGRVEGSDVWRRGETNGCLYLAVVQGSTETLRHTHRAQLNLLL